MKNAQLLVVRADSPITDRAGLAGKIIGTQEGSSSIDALDKNKEFEDSLQEVKKYGDFVNAFMDLEIGRTDGVLVDSVVGRYYMTKKEGKFKVIDDKMGDEQFGVGMRKDDKVLQDKLNDVLKQMTEDGTMTKLSDKWFGEDITIPVK
jgi:polar amino acid transport system substrate-binding protein